VAARPSEVELLEALYADATVREVLERHQVPIAPLAGPTWQLFPAAHNLTTELAAELYSDCGLALHHIELLTGRPAATIGGILRTSGVPLRVLPRNPRSCAAGPRTAEPCPGLLVRLG
jgi:hypothetical protein